MYQFCITSEDYARKHAMVSHTARQVRTVLKNAIGVGTDLCGYCIEASEEIVKRLRDIGFLAVTKEGWVEYTNPYAGYQRPYDAHTWVEVLVGFDRGAPGGNFRVLIVDVTGDQFNYGRYPEDQLSGIIVSSVLPKGYRYHNTEGLRDELNQSLERIAREKIGLYSPFTDIESRWSGYTEDTTNGGA